MDMTPHEASRELNRQCRDLARQMKSLPTEMVECEQPFNMDYASLDRIRFELITSHHQVVQHRAPFRLALDSKTTRETSMTKQINDLKIMAEIQREYMHNKEKESELNQDTRKCFNEILEAIEGTDDVELERSQAKRNLFQAKSQIKSVLEKFYPEYKSKLLAILEKLDKCSTNENKDEQWSDLSDHDITSVLILKRAMIIEQHEKNPMDFRFAPLS